MIDLKPVFDLALWAIAITSAFVIVVIAQIFTDQVATWHMLPLAIVIVMALKLTVAKD